MNKTELVDAIARETGLSKAHALAVVDSVIATVQERLAEGDDVTIHGFGKFSVSDRQARTGHNPNTGERIQLKASRSAKFSAGARLKAVINGNAGM